MLSHDKKPAFYFGVGNFCCVLEQIFGRKYNKRVRLGHIFGIVLNPRVEHFISLTHKIQ